MNIDNEKIYNDRYEAGNENCKYSSANMWLRYLIKKISKNTKKDKIKNILDVGCGEGTNTAFLTSIFKNANIVGIDITNEGIKFAQTKYKDVKNLEFLKDNIFTIKDTICSNRDGYNMVSAFEVIEHIEDWKPFLKTICNLSNRYVMLSFPTGRMRKHEPEQGHYRNFKKGEVENFMSENGFKSIKTFYAGFPFYSPLGRNWLEKNFTSYKKTITKRYSNKEKIFHFILYILFRFFSFDNIGDAFIGLFERIEK